MLGGSFAYIKKVRKANRPVIYLTLRPKGEYRFSVSIDLIEGFDNCDYQFTEYGNQKLSEIMTSKLHKTITCFGLVKCFAVANYTSFADATEVANSLVDLSEERGVWCRGATILC